MNERFVLGIDTSNYTCSAALLDTAENKAVQSKRLLSVPKGQKGVRQSDAVFEHTRLLPEMLAGLGGDIERISAVGASDRPSCRQGSYMPCFLVGKGAAQAVSLAKGIPLYTASHQTGHILAALYSAKRLDIVKSQKSFFAFHVSGGTTDLLLCKASDESLIDIKRIGGTSDLNAGQAIDRCGVMLGLSFPCGQALEKLAENCGDEKIKTRPSVKGMECSLSGIENKCRALFESDAPKEYIAAFCLNAVEAALIAVIEAAQKEYGSLEIICAGGVMSNSIISGHMKKRFDALVSEPELSRDNAVGMAVFAALMKGMI